MSGYEIAASLVGSVLGSGLVTGIFQVYLNHKFSTKLEELKTYLSGELFERQTKFAWLHTERSKALVKLYALLATVHSSFHLMLMPIQDADAETTRNRRNDSQKAMVEFSGFCSQNAVFFDDELQASLFQLDEKYRRVWSTYVPNRELLPTGTEWTEAWNKLGEEVV